MKRACGFVIFRRIQGTVEYLLMQTSYGAHHWTPPKGHVDPGESDLETAIRETKEEAGFTRNDLKIYENVKEETSYPVKGKPKIVIYWLAELIDQNKPVTMSDEHEDFKWLPIQEACELARHDEMKNILKNMNAYISEKLV